MVDGQISPWLPEQDRVRLAILGKLVEELNEASARAARCIIHGLDEIDPDSGNSNRDELAKEITDVAATAHMLVVGGMDIQVSDARLRQKVDGYCQWHELIKQHEGQND